ncbi:MAG: hypothetical protein JW953_12890 [Anaerolineae bacterium]|nr:hypothetical protein [Anaerolineae bacterium]
MTSEIQQTPATPAKIMHETFNQLSTIVSIAQFSLLNEEISPKLQEDLKRIIETVRVISNHLKHLAEMLEEE